MSWEDIDKKPDVVKNEKFDRLVNLSRHVFGTPEGNQLLDLLKDYLFNIIVITPGAPPEVNAIRQGEVNFIRKLISWATHKED